MLDCFLVRRGLRRLPTLCLSDAINPTGCLCLSKRFIAELLKGLATVVHHGFDGFPGGVIELDPLADQSLGRLSTFNRA